LSSQHNFIDKNPIKSEFRISRVSFSSIFIVEMSPLML
jgi:hypothetical protein